MENYEKTPSAETRLPAHTDECDEQNASATVPAPNGPTADADPNFAIDGE
jgi:hypothetical protein